MFDNYLKFTKEKDMYNVLKSDSEEVVEGIKKAYAGGIYCVSKSGHPVVIESWKNLQYQYILKNFSEDQIVRHF